MQNPTRQQLFDVCCETARAPSDGLIAKQAGAAVTEWPRNEPHGLRFLCTAPSIHNKLKPIIARHFNRREKSQRETQ